MKKLLLFILAALAVNVHTAFSWDSTAAKYMPLQVGNVWVYRSLSTPNDTVIFYKKIVASNMINGHLYYSLFNSKTNQTLQVRIDSSTGILVYYSQQGCLWLNQEKGIDSLSAKLNNVSVSDCNLLYRCSDTSNTLIFNQTYKVKNFLYTDVQQLYQRRYAEKIGLIYSNFTFHTFFEYDYLVACVINGVVYGDTSMLTGINHLSSEIPDNFSLSQNYPNPFNPQTHFEFRIAEFGFVKLTVFDIVGKEVQALVNQELSPGTYSVDFDGSNIPSGVYYYRIESGSFSDTKKMVLIK